jgi:hypothetical protein
MTEEESAARAALSKDVAQVADASGAGGPEGQGGMPMMGGGAGNTDILNGKSFAVGGLGPAFLSGFCAGTFAAKYLKDL